MRIKIHFRILKLHEKIIEHYSSSSLLWKNGEVLLLHCSVLCIFFFFNLILLNFDIMLIFTFVWCSHINIVRGECAIDCTTCNGALNTMRKKIYESHTLHIVISFVEKNEIENNLEKFVYCTLNSTHCYMYCCKAKWKKKLTLREYVWVQSLDTIHCLFSVIFIISMTWNEKMSSNAQLSECFFPHFYFAFFSLSLVWTENLEWYHFVLPLLFCRIKCRCCKV